MVDFEEQNKALVESLVALDVLKTDRVINAFLEVPRHKFVPEKYRSKAYHDIALPSIGDQTISQPYTVATMLEALAPDVGDNVLDVGSGTGWTTCLLAKIVGEEGKVTGIDIEPKLHELAQRNAAKFDLKNIELVLGNARKGYPKTAPYHCVLVNAACDNVPDRVKSQVIMGGRIVAPVNANMGQEMILFQKIDDNEFTRTNLGNYVFVELK